MADFRGVVMGLVGFGLLMMITAIFLVPEALPVERRHGGGLRQFASGLSTLPPGASRWLALDLPHRVRRRTDIPLTVLTTPKDH